MKRLLVLLTMSFLITTARSQNITAAEYFIDTDPGAGNGTAITISTPGDIVNFTASISTASLSAGFHFAGIRVKDVNGKWGLFEKRGFYISSSTADAANITAAEYFFDTDPGVGNGTAVSVGTSGPVVNFTAVIPTSLPAGFHFLSIRTKDASGLWGLFEKRGIYISSSTADAANIVAAEYFFDADPGVGNGTAVSVGTTGAVVNFTAVIPTALPAGFHFLSIRTRDASGLWGLFEKRGFYISGSTTDAADIVAAEYFFDADPGVGNGTAVSVGTTGAVVNFAVVIPTALPAGFHFLAIRTRGADGKWGLYEKRGFYISGATTDAANIVAAEYFFDADPGVGNGTAVSVGTTGTVVNFTAVIPISLPVGFHFLAIRTKGADGVWGLYEKRGFYVSSFAADAANIVAAEYFFDTDPGVGNGTALTITTPGGIVTETFNIPDPGLTLGSHFLAIRVKGLDGKWGLYEHRSFTIGNSTITCPANTAATTSPGECSVVVNGIDPVVTPPQSFTYTLTGATTGSGIGTASGQSFNAGATTVAYALTGSPTVNCSFTVTVTAIAPGITTHPASQSVCAGANVTFSVVATGSGLTYQWRKGGINIGGATSSSYTITGAVAGDAGSYDVVVSTLCGTNSPSAIATLTVGVTTITTHPTSQSVCPGSNVTFSVVATGAGLTYQWRKGGVNIGGATSPSFSIIGVVAGDAGSYDVVVTGNCGNATSNAAVLTINASTVITTNPASQAVCAAANVTFSVVATGTGVLTYQWKKNNIDIGGANSFDYTINGVSAGDAANYTVAVSGTCGTATSLAAVLTVNAVTVITAQPTNQSSCIGGSVTFSVTATGTGITYQWKKNTIDIGGATSSTYTINPVTAGDAATYSVVVSGTCGTMTSNDVTLTITAGTTINTQPAGQSSCLGGSVTFNVSANGSGTLTYQWKKNTVDIPGATLASYTINPVTAGDAANYTVVVTSSCGSITSNIATLTILPATGITTQPASQTVCSGSNATFTVAAAGDNLTYQWRKAGINIGGATSPSFTIVGVTAGDVSNYDVVVTGTCGSVTSNTVSLSLGNVVINTHPISQIVCAGNNVTFSVAATGTGITYQWRKGGINIGGATSSSFTITGVVTGDAGSYDVLVIGTCGTVTSNSATLTVNTSPAITSQPGSQAVCVGSNVTFSVIATGTGLSYQWRKGGVNIGGATSSSFTITGVVTGDAGSFDVVVTGTCPPAVISNAAILTVNTAPAITSQPVSQSVCTGSNISFSVTATGTGLTYQWRKGGVNIGGATSSTFTINGVATGDAGSYDVVVTGACAPAVTSNAAILTINVAPAITSQPVSQSVCPGTNVTFSVTATGTSLTYQWRKGGVNISGATGTSYTINGVVTGDAGNYDVTVSSPCGTVVTSTIAALTINITTVITTQPANQSVCAGANVTFNVAASGSVGFTYQWQVSTNGGGAYNNIPGATAGSLTLTNVTLALSNNLYRCVVTGSCGTINSSGATLIVNNQSQVSIGSLPARICLSDTLVALNATPAGGIWSGTGVVGNNFLPYLTSTTTFTLKYVVTNSFGCKDSATVNANVELCPERSRTLRNGGVVLYPNPNNGRFSIRLNSSLYNSLGMRVYSSQGALIRVQQFGGLQYGRVIQVDLSELAVGVYPVTIYSQNGGLVSQITFKMIIAGH